MMGFRLFDAEHHSSRNPPADARVAPCGTHVSIYSEAAARTRWQPGDLLYGAIDPDRPGTFALIPRESVKPDKPPTYLIRVANLKGPHRSFRCACAPLLRAAKAIPGAYYNMTPGAGGWVFVPADGSRAT